MRLEDPPAISWRSLAKMIGPGIVMMGIIAVLGAFAGYVGSGGLGNSTYSNFVRDKDWGMGRLVGAIPSALGGKSVGLSQYGTPKLMTIVIANLNNVAIGITSFVLIWMNRRLLPPALRPRWFNTIGVLGCGVFYVGMSALVFVHKQLPDILEMVRGGK